MYKLLLHNNTKPGTLRLLNKAELVDTSFSKIRSNIDHYLSILRARIEDMLRELGIDTSIPEPDLPITPNESAQNSSNSTADTSTQDDGAHSIRH
jgi:hypothetical protein